MIGPWIAVIVSFVVAIGITPLCMLIARRYGIVDDPQTAPERKKQARPIPLLGGLAIIVATWVTWLVLWRGGYLADEIVTLKQILSVSVAGGILAVGGVIDDRWHLSARRQIWWVIVAVAIVVAGGIGVTFITNPFGGILDLTAIQWTLVRWHDVPYHLTLWADLFTFVWLLGASYTTKILDGLDGLVSGLGIIGGMIVFLLTLRPEVHQAGVGMIALSLVGASAGFLYWNWHPAKVYLGEAGSLYIGFMLGVVSIISGGKIATALLILGLPILDLLWVMIQRVRNRRSPFTSADRFHLHFRLLDAGFSVRQSVLIIFSLVTVFGVSTLYVHGAMKVVVLAALGGVMAILVWWVMRRIQGRTEHPV